MKKILIILLILLALSVICLAKKSNVMQKPAWVDDPKSEYPETVYLSSVGSGSGRQEAQNTAMGNLARIFEANVKSTSEYNERYKELITDQKCSSESATELNKSTTVSADQKLLNMEIGPSWTDDLGQVYTIAYINRQKTADIYSQKIDENDKRIKYFMDQQLLTKDPKSIYANLSAAAVIGEANQILLDQLAIISPDDREMTKLSYGCPVIMKSLSDAASLIHFNVNIENDDRNKITAQFTSLLSDMGFGLNPENAIQINGNVLFEEVDLQASQKFIRYTLNVDVKDANGISLFTMTDIGREGHINYPEARARAVRTITGKIQNDFKKRLVGYFDGLVQKK